MNEITPKKEEKNAFALDYRLKKGNIFFYLNVEQIGKKVLNIKMSLTGFDFSSHVAFIPLVLLHQTCSIFAFVYGYCYGFFLLLKNMCILYHTCCLHISFPIFIFMLEKKTRNLSVSAY